jgi:hypothetical protein
LPNGALLNEPVGLNRSISAAASMNSAADPELD